MPFESLHGHLGAAVAVVHMTREALGTKQSESKADAMLETLVPRLVDYRGDRRCMGAKKYSTDLLNMHWWRTENRLQRSMP
jgi:hypothetical protein